MKLLAAFLERRGHTTLATREPGGTAIGDQIRKTLLDHANQDMVPRTEILLFLASRAQHTAERIRPALERGEIVLCDRFRDSTVAYQGHGHGVDLQDLHQFNDFATSGLMPDLTLLLDVSVEVGLNRREKAGGWNRLDAYELAFHERVRRGFHSMAAAEPDRWRVISAEGDVETVQAQTQQAVQTVLDK
jgi:dTMP kinase